MSEKEQRVNPLWSQIVHVPESKLSFEVACFGGDELSLESLQKSKSVTANRPMIKRLASALSSLGATCVFALNSNGSSAEIVPHTILEQRLVLGEGMQMRYVQGRSVAGTYLSAPKHAGILSTDDGVIVVSNGHDIVFAQINLESLLPKKQPKNARKRRKISTGVVGNAISALGNKPKNIHIWLLLFRKPSYCRFNDAIKQKVAIYLSKIYGQSAGYIDVEGMHFDLAGMTREQAKKCGVPAENIHCCYQHMSKKLLQTQHLIAIARQ